MQAAVLHNFGSIAQNLRVEVRPPPALKPGCVLVRMHAAAINPSDLVFLNNQYGIKKDLPVVPGFEGSGRVIAAAAGWYPRWLVGKRVACRAPDDGDGTWADLLACPARSCIPLRQTVSFEQGATLYVNPLTAWYLLQRVRQKGHRGFIQTAAASAVGRMVARLARRQNIPAIHVVRRPEHVELLKNEGADYVLDSSLPDFAEQLKTFARQVGATIGLDAVGKSLTAIVANALPPGSELVVYGALGGGACEINPADLIFYGKSVTGFWLTKALARIHPLKSAYDIWQVQGLLGAELQTHIQASFPLENIHDAIQQYKLHRANGKVLLTFSRA